MAIWPHSYDTVWNSIITSSTQDSFEDLDDSLGTADTLLDSNIN
jgi:hypothetical protein